MTVRFRGAQQILRVVRAPFLLGLAAAAGLTIILAFLELAPSGSAIELLLGLKAGIVALVTSTIVFFEIAFFQDLSTARPSDYPHIALDYLEYIVVLLPADLILFVSVGMDFYLVVASDTVGQLTGAVSFGTFGASLLMLLVFIIRFSYRFLDRLLVPVDDQESMAPIEPSGDEIVPRAGEGEGLEPSGDEN